MEDRLRAQRYLKCCYDTVGNELLLCNDLHKREEDH